MRGLFRIAVLALLFWGLLIPAGAADFQEEAAEEFGADAAAENLPEAAQAQIGDWSELEADNFGAKLGDIISAAAEAEQSSLRRSGKLCLSILAIVVLSAALRALGQTSASGAMELAGVLAISTLCYGALSGFYTQAAEAVDEMSVFAAGLYSALAAATAATGNAGTGAALYSVTAALCGVVTRALNLVFLPAISCYMALVTASHALGDEGLGLMAKTLRQLLGSLLKFAVVGVTAYLSLTGVVSGSADAAAVRAAKLTISAAVPVVGSMIADASETLLVSAGMIRGSLGLFGLLGVIAVSIGPFLRTGCGYLLLKCTAALSASTGEKTLSGLTSAMADAMGLLTAVTGVCALLLMIGCVCFMRGSTG